MKNVINVYDEKNNINKNNERSEEARLTSNEKTEEYDKFKNRMKALFNEFEKDNNNKRPQISSAINFKRRTLIFNNIINNNYCLYSLNSSFWSCWKSLLLYYSSASFRNDSIINFIV